MSTVHLLDQLREAVSGPILVPGEDGYAAAVRGHNLAVQHRPSAVAVVTDAEDVAAAVRIAAAHRLPVSVLATGHGTSAAIDGGLAIVTGRLDRIAVETEARTLTVGAGVTSGSAVEAAEREGFTLPGGSAASVGVVGFSLGGGLGPLGRAFGWASDWLRSIELVDPSGRLRTVHPTDTDLFWAMCGGKLGLGVVTAMTFELIPTPVVVGRRAVVDGIHGAAMLRRWLALTEPASSTSSIRLMVLPDVPVVPEPLRGRHVAELTMTSCGPDADLSGTRWAELLEGLPTLVQQECSGGLTEWYATLGDPDGAMPTWQAGRLLSRLDDEGAEALLHAVHPDWRMPFMVTEVRRLGGRLGTYRADAVGGRDAAYLLNVIGIPEPSLFPEVLPAAFAAVERRLQPWLHGGTQINFHGPVTDDNPIARAWPTGTADRLADIRRRMDPAGLFRR